MKKFLALLTAAVLVVSMTACASQPSDPKALYKEAVAKTGKLESIDVSMKVTMDMTAAGESITVTTTTGIQLDQSASTPKMAMKSNVEVPGQGNVELMMYYADGYIYLDSNGQKVKQAASSEDALSGAAGMAVEEIEEKAFKDLKMETKDGVTTLTFTADGAQMTEYVQTLLASSQTVTSADELKISDVTGKVTVNKDQYITGMTMNIPLTMTVSGQEFTCNLALDITYNNPGQPVNIDFPDFSEYTEIAA